MPLFAEGVCFKAYNRSESKLAISLGLPPLPPMPKVFAFLSAS